MSSNRHFILDSIVFQSLNWLIKPVWIFLIDREVQNYLGLEVYGNYQIHFNFTFLFMILLDLGMHNYQTREVAENRDFLKTGTPGLVWFKMILSLFYIGLVWYAGLLNGLASFWLLAIGLNQLLNSWIMFLRTTLAGLHLFRIEAVVSVLDRTIAGIACGIFLFTPNLRSYFRLEEFVFLQTIALALGLLFVIYVCIKKGALFKISLPDFSNTKRLLKANMPFAILTLVMVFYTRLDVIFMNSIIPETANYEVGIYAHSYRFLEASSMYTMLFTGMLMPVISRKLAERENFSSLLNLVLKLVLIPGIWLAVIAYQRGFGIIDLLYTTDNTAETQHSADVFFWLMASYLPMSASLVYGALLTAANKIKHLIYVSTIALAILSFFCMTFIPESGALGTAKAVFITHCSVLVLSLILVRIHFPKQSLYKLNLFAKLIGMGAIIWLSSWFLTTYIEVNLTIYLLLTLIVTVLLIFGFRMFDLSQIKNLRKG